jgi:hypothetical protein
MEWGTYSRNAETGLMTISMLFDNNGDTGLTDFANGFEDLYITVDPADTLNLSIDANQDGIIDEIFPFQRAQSDGLVGTWINTTTNNDLLVVVFFEDGTYLHMEIDENEPFDEQPELSGMEWGTYSRNADTGFMTITLLFDNNGDTGLTDFANAIEDLYILDIPVNSLTASIDENRDGTIDGTIVFERQTLP